MPVPTFKFYESLVSMDHPGDHQNDLILYSYTPTETYRSTCNDGSGEIPYEFHDAEGHINLTCAILNFFKGVGLFAASLQREYHGQSLFLSLDHLAITDMVGFLSLVATNHAHFGLPEPYADLPPFICIERGQFRSAFQNIIPASAETTGQVYFTLSDAQMAECRDCGLSFRADGSLDMRQLIDWQAIIAAANPPAVGAVDPVTDPGPLSSTPQAMGRGAGAMPSAATTATDPTALSPTAQTMDASEHAFFSYTRRAACENPQAVVARPMHEQLAS